MSNLLESNFEKPISTEKIGISSIDSTQLLSDGRAALTAMTITQDSSNKDVGAMLGGFSVGNSETSGLSIKNIDSTKPMLLAKENCDALYKEAQSTGDETFAEMERTQCAKRNATENTPLDTHNKSYGDPMRILNDLLHHKDEHIGGPNKPHDKHTAAHHKPTHEESLHKLCEMDIQKYNQGEKRFEAPARACEELNL